MNLLRTKRYPSDYQPGMPKIDVQNMSVTFRNTSGAGIITAVQDLTLSVNKNEFVCVVGPSGGGKTTLLRAVAGLEPPSIGRAVIHGEDSTRPNFGMVFQAAGLFPWMTVLENVAYGMRIQGIGGKRRYTTAQTWINRVGLSRFVDAFPSQLSGGMQQRVGLARAFAHNPEVLLMDEPFGALDAQTRQVLQETLLSLWKESDMTVLFVTHSIEEALTLSDKIVVMSARPGRILQSFDVPFSRPRDVVALRTLPAFGQYQAQIWDVLRDEVSLALKEQL